MSSCNSDMTESGAIYESGTKDSGVISMALESCSTTSSIAISMESGANSSDVESVGAGSMASRAASGEGERRGEQRARAAASWIHGERARRAATMA